MDKLIEEYRKKFGEIVPLMLCRGCDDDEIIEIIKECISSNKSYTVDNGDY